MQEMNRTSTHEPRDRIRSEIDIKLDDKATKMKDKDPTSQRRTQVGQSLPGTSSIRHIIPLNIFD